jgi:heme/copper-type cytochrome/quinol oxidase subunit 4
MSQAQQLTYFMHFETDRRKLLQKIKILAKIKINFIRV